MGDETIHPLLRRQLRRSGIVEGSQAADPAAWARFLDHVGQAYGSADQDRYLLERALTISSRETRELYASLAEEHESQARRRIAEQRASLLDLSHAVVSTLSLDEVLDRVLQAIQQVAPYDSAGLYWVVEPEGVLRRAHVASGPPEAQELTEWDLPIAGSIAGAVARSGVGELVNNAHQDPRSLYPPGVAVTDEHLIAEPVFGGSNVVGVLLVSRLNGAPFTTDESELVRLFINHASAAIQNARLFAQLRESERKFRSLFERSPDAVFMSAPDGMLLDLNAAGVELLGSASRSDLLGRGLYEFFVDPEQHLHLVRMLAMQGFIKDWEVVLRTSKGEQRWVQITADAEYGDGSVVAAHRGFIRDVTERRQVLEALEHQALHDALTGLPNRTLLLDRLHQAIRSAERRTRRKSLVLLLMDLDRFKEVNDTFGHHYGDILLQQLAQRLRAVLRGSDSVARLGGDEFAVLLPTADAEGAKTVARHIITAVEPVFIAGGHTLRVAASIGAAVFPDHGSDAETLMRRADVAMYAAKRSGTGFNLYRVDQDVHAPNRLSFANDLHQAVDRNELVLHYQPEVAMIDRQVVRLEALVRWQHPIEGLVPPDRFIPLAEQTGAIRQVGVWALAAAMQQCRAWNEAGRLVPVAVNLSMRNLHDPALPAALAALLADWPDSPRWLTVEITESTVMADPARAMDVLTRLREMGVATAIDDFGTGFSSLAHLKRLPLDELKIDRAFVRDLASDENDAAIVRSTISLGHDLGLRVVAEGVEDETAWNMLSEFGCDFAQGYFIGAPLPAPDLARWLRESHPGWSTGVPGMQRDPSPAQSSIVD